MAIAAKTGEIPQLLQCKIQVLPHPSSHLQPGEEELGEMKSSRGISKTVFQIQDPLAPVPGFTDYTSAQMQMVGKMQQIVQRVFQIHAFSFFQPRPVENTFNLLSEGNMDKQMFGVSRLPNIRTHLALPFDRTMPFAIWLAAHLPETKFPFSRADIGWALRGENPQKGRYRGFIQADVDTVAPHIRWEHGAEILNTLIDALCQIGVPPFIVCVNDRRLAEEFLLAHGIKEETFPEALRILDKMKRDEEGKVLNREEILTLLIDLVGKENSRSLEELIDSVSYRGPISGFDPLLLPSERAREAFKELQKVQQYCEDMGRPRECIQFDPSLARGLSYYTGMVFETFIQGGQRFGSIMSGGAYADLCGDLVEAAENLKSEPNQAFIQRAKEIQGVGGSIGITRLFDVLQDMRGVSQTRQSAAEIIVACRHQGDFEKACQAVSSLRGAGIPAELYLQEDGVNPVSGCLKSGGAKGIPYALVLNGDKIFTKDLRGTKEQPGRQEDFLELESAIQGAVTAVEKERSTQVLKV